MVMSSSDLQAFAIDFRDALIGTQPRASHMMCAVVSMPLRAALKVLRDVDTELVTEDGHTFLVTVDGQYRIDPTIDQFSLAPSEKVLVEANSGAPARDAVLAEIPFVELLEEFKRLYGADGQLSAAEAGSLVAKYVYLPLARQGVFEGR